MSWNDNHGGKSPWGRKKSGGEGGEPPDLEAFLKKSQEHLKSILPKNNSPSPFSQIPWGISLFLFLLLWGYMSVYRIEPDENGIILRLGAYDRTAVSGVTVAVWPFERLEKVKVTAENQINFSDSLDGSTLMLAGDQNLVNVEFSVFWRVRDAQEYLFNLLDPEQLIVQISESAIREVVGRTNAEEIRTRGRQEAQRQVHDLIQKTLDSYRSGILISGVQLKKADPPPPVIDAFEEVQRAEQNQNKLIREAEKYRNQLLGQSRGEAAKIVEDAKAYRSRVTAEAEGESQRFLSVYNAYSQSPQSQAVTRRRLFLETMEDILKKTDKVILDGGKEGVGVLPYLPLPQINRSKIQAPSEGAQP